MVRKHLQQLPTSPKVPPFKDPAGSTMWSAGWKQREMSVFPSITTDITQINSLCWNILLVHKFPSRTTRCQMIGCADWGGCWPGATEQVRTASPPPTYSSGCRLIAGTLTGVTIQGGNLKLPHSEEPPTVINTNSASHKRKSLDHRGSKVK